MSQNWIAIYDSVKHLPKEQREGAFRSAWLAAHKDADSIVFDVNTGVPHQAVYDYPLSTIAADQWLKVFFAEVQKLQKATVSDTNASERL